MTSDPNANKFTLVHQLQPGMKNLHMAFIVLEVGAPRRTTQGNDVRTIKIADHTGAINMSIWNDLGEYVTPGDIFRLRNGSTSVYKGQLALTISKSGEMLKTGEFLMPYSDLPDMSAYNAEFDAKYPQRKGSPEDDKEDANGNGGNSASGNGSTNSTNGNQENSSSSNTRPIAKRRHVGASSEMPTKINANLMDKQRRVI